VPSHYEVYTLALGGCSWWVVFLALWGLGKRLSGITSLSANHDTGSLIGVSTAVPNSVKLRRAITFVSVPLPPLVVVLPMLSRLPHFTLLFRHLLRPSETNPRVTTRCS